MKNSNVASMALGATLVALLTGCAGGGGGGGNDPVSDLQVASTPEAFDYFAMFVDLADQVILPNYETLHAQADALGGQNGAISQYCAAIGTGDEASTLDGARQAWRGTMAALQTSELHQIGPIAADEGNLHDRLIAPADTNFSTCGVDQSVILSQSPGFDLESRLSNQKGLTAVEYLLFNEDLGETCPPQIPETVDWNERPELERKTLRCEHAQLLADDIADAAAYVFDAWHQDGGNFRAVFARPENQERFLEELSDALFYLEKDTKDRKLGEPLGLQENCSQLACPDRVESPWSRESLAHIGDNLDGFLLLFTGGTGLGFDDIIASEGFPDVAIAMIEDTQSASAAAGAIDASLLDQAQGIVDSGSDVECANASANPDANLEPSTCTLHGLVKRIADRLRTDFVTIVNLDLPERAQSDND